MQLELRSPAIELVDSYRACIIEMKDLGETISESILPAPAESDAEFVTRLLRRETSPEPPQVPESLYWGVLGERVVGRISLRHFLNGALAEFGGHIGYEVRPSNRRQGIASELLKQILKTPKAREIGKLLLTCAPNNVPSIKTIMANGGVLSKTIFVERIKRDTNHYWIDLG